MARLASRCEYSEKSRQRKRVNGSPRGFRSCVAAAMIILLAGATAAMLIFSLLERVELIKQNDVNVELCEQLEEIRKENRHLAIEYECAIDMDGLEQYAKNELGMYSGALTQPEKIDVETQDKAQILGKR